MARTEEAHLDDETARRRRIEQIQELAADPRLDGEELYDASGLPR
ncbi:MULTISPECIES: hypothetical protein [Aeromicrobium]|uniref:Uncharacterized protein n=1 Tax=Aeromicrobium tamlense TaxID=375541 RepID=A0ABX2SIW4_9ACTN|nr:hypothetical protein [Aeromicrobium tamlense]NYI38834.1 hypothetical protein [Aeromicrobium tamlense]